MVCYTVYVECNERNITVKANILQKPLFICECPSSQSRNKAKNALSLAATISPVLAGAKIDKNSFGWREKQQIFQKSAGNPVSIWRILVFLRREKERESV